MLHRFPWTLVLLVALTPETEAQGCAVLADPGERLACYDQLAQCVTTHEADQRLACYDAAQDAPASSSRDSAASPEQQAGPPVQAADEVFPVPGTPREERDEPTQLVARIAKVDQGPRGRHYLTLDNGQVWRELSKGRFRFQPGTEVEISRGILGSVNLRVEGSRGYVKVRRVR